MAQRYIVKDIYKKTGNSTGTLNKIGTIGVKGENVELDKVDQHHYEGTAIADSSIASTNRIYYNNVQAQMIRKGCQIVGLNTSVSSLNTSIGSLNTSISDLISATSSLNTTISSLTGATSNYILRTESDGGTASSVNKVLTQGSTFIPNKIITTVASLGGNAKLPDISPQDPENPDNFIYVENQKDHLGQIIPYIKYVSPQMRANPAAAITTAGTNDVMATGTVPRWNTSDLSIKGNDTWLNVARKFNSLYALTLKDEAIIDKYYKQKEPFIVRNSKVRCSLGWPSVDGGTLNFDGGNMRYRVYDAPFSMSTITQSRTTTYGAESTYSGRVVGSYNPTSASQLYDADVLPTAPAGYVWKCKYVRGTYPYPNMTETNVYGSSAASTIAIWDTHPTFRSVAGYVQGKEISFEYPIANLYKGTSFDNLIDLNMPQTLWNSVLLNSNSMYPFDNYTGPNMTNIGSIFQADLPIKIKFFGQNSQSTNANANTAAYLYRRVIGHRKYPNQDGEYAMYKIGTKYAYPDAIRFSLACFNDFGTYVYDFSANASSTNPFRTGAIGAAIKKLPVQLEFKTPFMYAEYELVKLSDLAAQGISINPLEWYNYDQSSSYDPDSDS